MLRFWPGVAVTLLITLAHSFSAADEAPLTFVSGADRVALIELFTSEGCSSCPPADRWLSGRKNDKKLWRDYVPIAFHVDYWDRLGWKDRFASSENSKRQRRYAQEGGTQVVYTPGFFRNGQEWRRWRNIGSINDRAPYAGNLIVQVTGDDVTVSFDTAHLEEENLSVHIAVLGMNVESDVRAGENKGRVLKHDFVSLAKVTTSLDRSADGFAAVTQIPSTSLPDADKALVAWVSSDDAQAPIQAVGGYLRRQ